MAELTKIEIELLKEIDKDAFFENRLPYKRGDLEITHKGTCPDAIALFRPQQIICYAGTFRGKEFVAIGGTDEGFDDSCAVAAVSRVHSVVIKKVKRWIRKDTWLRRALPFKMIPEVDKGVLY